MATDLSYGYGLTRLASDPAPMTVKESTTLVTLLAEYRAQEEDCCGEDEPREKSAIKDVRGAAAMGQGPRNCSAI
ncbi:hypothetical protein GCM10010991_32170 [Gemmobacter aquaticus]|uniref:Uncharacterized protein n=1 Tax=Gemmobacter aquaticus TaxID=490185 RepID=A0A917YQ02_9RHOB|nr:hypothetical protein [Gemmobacter aquaticus]GGO37097.1 hypothetical protein GCM10010991_32170 [Gemmobacter aquaticus]